MNILFYRYGSICEPDILQALEELGHTVSQITEEITNKNILMGECARLLGSYLLDHPQDCVFTVNFFPAISEVCNIFHIIYLCWTVDAPILELYAKPIQNPYNRVFLFDKMQYQEIAPLNPGHVFHLPLAANVSGKQQVISSASACIRQKFTHEVSFVGSLYTEKCPYDSLTAPPRYLMGYLNGLMEAQLKIYGSYFIDEILTDDILQDFKKHMPDYYTYPLDSFLTDRITIGQFYIGNKITAVERLRTLNYLSQYFSVNLYTGSDSSCLPNIISNGLVKSQTEMPVIFHQSNINLNMTSRTIRSGLPQRIFDIMGSGGFVLTNYQAELPELFEIGTDLAAYGSMDELAQLIRYYLEHEKQRQEIARTGYENVKQNHTYPIRMEKLLKLAFSI